MNKKSLLANIFFSSLSYLFIISSHLHGTEKLDNIASSVHDLVALRGFSEENHTIHTEDGYILTLHRVINPTLSTKRNSSGVVLLGHCLMGSSATFVFGERDNSLAFMLVDQGYDVWMLNVRGNIYSRQHENLEPFLTDFWDFSFHESAIFDYPAVIDYILNVTLSPDLSFVGYSMGATQYLILLSERPEYNEKIRAGYLLGAPACIGEASHPVITMKEAMIMGLDIFGIKELYSSDCARANRVICTLHPLLAQTCHYLWSELANTDDEQDTNLITTLVQMSNVPAGASLKTFQHYFQMKSSGQFSQFDYGSPQANMEKYGETEPPVYNLSNVQVPTSLFCGDGDVYTTLGDIGKLAMNLPNLKQYHVVQRKGWTHLDFAYSSKAGILVYQNIIDDLNGLN